MGVPLGGVPVPLCADRPPPQFLPVLLPALLAAGAQDCDRAGGAAPPARDAFAVHDFIPRGPAVLRDTDLAHVRRVQQGLYLMHLMYLM